MLLRSSEQALIRRAKAGDAQAIEKLIRVHQEALYAFMLRLGGRADIAEDIVQEAFVRVLGNLDRFDTRFRFSTWLFTIAKRLYVNAMQKHGPMYDSDAVGLRTGDGPTPGRETADSESRHNAREMIHAALARLNPVQREVILLFHQQNWPISDIAAHLSMPEGTIKSHLHRARRRMQRTIMSSPAMAQHAAEAWS
jgi:RNA polymerase sigma-70 factor (ECF subfamily)